MDVKEIHRLFERGETCEFKACDIWMPAHIVTCDIDSCTHQFSLTIRLECGLFVAYTGTANAPLLRMRTSKILSW